MTPSGNTQRPVSALGRPLPPSHGPSAFKVVSPGRRGGRAGTYEATRTEILLGGAGAGGVGHLLAQVHWPAPEGTGVLFSIHGVAEHVNLCSVKRAGADAYEVYSPDGALLAQISRRGARFLPWPRRLRWTVETGSAGEPFVGKSGTWYAWTSYVVLACLVSIGVAMAVYSWFEGDSDVSIDPPRHTRWRRRGDAVVLDWRGLSDPQYHLVPQALDYRVAYAQAFIASSPK